MPSGYVRSPYVQDPRTMLDLMRLASADRSRSDLQRAQLRSQGVMNIGQLIAGTLASIREEREQRALAQAQADKLAREEAFKRRDQQIREAQVASEIAARQGAAERQAAQDARQSQLDASARGAGVVKDIGGYGPLAESQVDDVMQSPAASRTRYSFGPGMTNGPEVMPNAQQVQDQRARQTIEGMGGTLGPNGQVVMPPKPEREPNPTEASLAMLAAKGDKMAAQALQTLQSMRQRTGSNEPRPLTQTAEAQIIQRLSTQWNTATKPLKELNRQVALMDSGMEAVKRGDRAQGDQVVLVTFQKILDPPSVVRESEFMRSAAGQALMARVKGAYEQLRVGGAGMGAEQLQKFANLAREAAAAQRKAAGLEAIKSRLSKTAQRYNIPDELIFDDSLDATTAPSPVTPKTYLSTDPNFGQPVAPVKKGGR